MDILDNSFEKAKLSFNSFFCGVFNLQFDCVIGENISHKFPLHIHDSLCIGVITKGQRNMYWSDRVEIINCDEVFVINKNQPHAIEQIEPHDYIAITIKGDTANVFFENTIQSKVCLDLFFQLFYALMANNRDIISEKWTKLSVYLTDKHKISDSLSSNETFICKALDYIQTNYQNPIAVNDIAAHTNMSIFHFCRLFKQFTGLSPHSYLKQIRLSQSYKHLQENTPVFDTAIETGFYDSSHFIKTFRSYMAVSPSEYQKSILKK